MDVQLRQEIIKFAKKRQLAYYSELAPIVRLDLSDPHQRKLMGEYLGEISEHEHSADRPLLSAIVVDKSTKEPGKGFFTLARDLQIFAGESERAFFERECQRVFDHWSSQEG
ncbi:MAG TPA: hypothetical protein VG797_00400 [Phycisphaerales bacterium]|nr:hypothetical protein [Phycisphaerales bacterium]